MQTWVPGFPRFARGSGACESTIDAPPGRSTANNAHPHLGLGPGEETNAHILQRITADALAGAVGAASPERVRQCNRPMAGARRPIFYSRRPPDGLGRNRSGASFRFISVLPTPTMQDPAYRSVPTYTGTNQLGAYELSGTIRAIPKSEAMGED